MIWVRWRITHRACDVHQLTLLFGRFVRKKRMVGRRTRFADRLGGQPHRFVALTKAFNLRRHQAHLWPSFAARAPNNAPGTGLNADKARRAMP